MLLGYPIKYVYVALSISLYPANICEVPPRPPAYLYPFIMSIGVCLSLISSGLL